LQALLQTLIDRFLFDRNLINKDIFGINISQFLFYDFLVLIFGLYLFLLGTLIDHIIFMILKKA